MGSPKNWTTMLLNREKKKNLYALQFRIFKEKWQRAYQKITLIFYFKKCHIQLASIRLIQTTPQCESSCFGVVTLETDRFLEALIGEEVPVTLDEGMN